MNFFYPDDNSVVISTDEITTHKRNKHDSKDFCKGAGKEAMFR